MPPLARRRRRSTHLQHAIRVARDRTRPPGSRTHATRLADTRDARGESIAAHGPRRSRGWQSGARWYTTGWQGTDASPVFLLPDGTTLGDATEAVVLHNPPHNAGQRCAVKGTLDEWKTEVAAKAAGNSLATFCISAALAPPLLAVTGDQGGGFHLFGELKTWQDACVTDGVVRVGPSV